MNEITISKIAPTISQDGKNKNMISLSFYDDFKELGDYLEGTIPLDVKNQVSLSKKATTNDPWIGYKDYIKSTIIQNINNILDKKA